MTIAEAHIDLQLGLDKIGSVAPELSVEEADLWINKAYLRYIKTHYGKNNLYQLGYEENQKRREDLKGLIKTKYGKPEKLSSSYKVSLNTLYDDEAFSSQTTEEYMFLVKLEASITTNNCTNIVELKIVDQDKLGRIKFDPFNKSNYSAPKAYYEDDSIYILGDFTVNYVNITYIKYPEKVKYGSVYSTPTADVEFTISKHTHDEIIQLAVTLIIENYMSQRVQTIQIPNNNTE